MNPDIGAAIDRDDAVAEMLTPQAQQTCHQGDFLARVGRRSEDLIADAKSRPVLVDVTVEAIDDQRAVIRGGEDKRNRSVRVTHRNLLGGRAGGQAAARSVTAPTF